MYIGSFVSDEGSKPEILSRIVQTTAALTKLKPVGRDRSIFLSSKVQLMHSLVTSILWNSLQIMDPHSRATKKNTSHGNEVLPQDTVRFIQRPCYQRGSLCQYPIGNRPHEDFLTMAKRRKLKWYGHVSCWGQ